jgi:hypothetical protein
MQKDAPQGHKTVTSRHVTSRHVTQWHRWTYWRYSLCGWSDMSSALMGEILTPLGGPMLTTRDGTTRWWWWSVARVVAGLGLLARRQPPPPPPPPPHGSGRPQHQPPPPPPPDRSTTARQQARQQNRGHNEFPPNSHVPAPHSTVRFVERLRHNGTQTRPLLLRYALPASGRRGNPEHAYSHGSHPTSTAS